MNACATAAFLERGHRVIDNMQLTLPFSHNHESPDNAHWYATAAMTAMEDLVAHSADLCPVLEGTVKQSTAAFTG